MALKLRVYAGNKRGIADGIASTAYFDSPTCAACAPNGDIWIVDQGNVRIRKIVDDAFVSSLTGTRAAPYQVSTSIGGTETTSTDTFTAPVHLSHNDSGEAFVVDQSGNRVRKMSAGRVYTVVQNGLKSYREGCNRSLLRPNAVRVDHLGDLWIANTGMCTVFHVVNIAEQRQVSNMLLDWTNLYEISSNLEKPLDIAFSPMFPGHALIADAHRIKLLRRTEYRLDIYAGQEVEGYLDGWRGRAKFGRCRYLLVVPNGDILVSDDVNQCIRYVSMTGMVSTFVGSTTSSSCTNPTIDACLVAPAALCWTKNGDLVIPDSSQHLIFAVDLAHVPTKQRINLSGSFEPNLKMSTKPLIHKQSGRSMPVFESIIALASLNILDTDSAISYLENTSLSAESIEIFLQLISGECLRITSTETALETLVCLLLVSSAVPPLFISHFPF